MGQTGTESESQAGTDGMERELDGAGKYFLESHLKAIRRKVIEHAVQLSNDEKVSHPPLEVRFVAEAVKDFAPGIRVPRLQDAAEPEPSWWERFWGGITAVTILAAILALSFGVLAVLNPITGQQSSFLDLAKLMAGAIVGSAGTAVVAARKKG